ncbi:unnamed protein product [Hyaloperonospora brassicae]|uniref:Urease accessory protein UreH-like transmembrane domain-containing protein n=1 Tax=Hyaloperonospora brassicae TaxID=162125 RepID=A0AAV0TCL8_HYABA|nr:unnamed protein product [Hyaloperonospora brassicae]
MAAVSSSLDGAPVPSIVAAGLLMGLVHVLTGPDHLSALIVLSAGSSWRSCQLGLRWGCGHSTGLVVVTACFLALGQHVNVNAFGTDCDFLVGFLMIGLGLWSLRHYLLLRHQLLQQPPPPLAEATWLLRQDVERPLVDAAQTNDTDGATHETGPSPAWNKSPRLTARDGRHDDNDDDTTTTTAPAATRCCCGLVQADIKNPRTQQLTAFAYGTAHGLAGTGGVLGVLPAVILNDWTKSSAYLGAFCLSSIATMGAFAALYGEVTGRVSRVSAASLVRIGVFSSCVSLGVGVMWVALVLTGTLDEVFG